MAMYTSTTRYTGLSGIDTESMVQALMQAESIKYDRLKKTAQKLEWKQEQYRSASSILDTFNSTFLKINGSSGYNMRSPSTFLKFNNTITKNGSTSSAVTVRTSSESKNKSYELLIKQLAQKETYSSKSDLASSITGKNTVTLSDLAIGDAFYVSLDGASKRIEIDTDAMDILTGVTNPGSLTPASSFDDRLEYWLNQELVKAFGNETIGGVPQQKVSCSVSGGILSITTAPGHAIGISDAFSRSGSSALNSTFFGSAFTAPGIGTSTINVQVGSGAPIALNITIDGTETPDQLVSKVWDEIVSNGLSDCLYVGMTVDNTNPSDPEYSFEIGVINSRDDISITETGGCNLMGSLGITLPHTFPRTSSLSGFGLDNYDTNSLDLSKTMKELFDPITIPGFNGTGTAIDPFWFELNGTIVQFEEQTTLQDFMKEVSKAGFDLTYNETTQRFTLECKTEGAEYELDYLSNADLNAFMTMFNFNSSNPAHAVNYIQGQDSIFEIDGVETSRTSNTFTYEGTTFTLNEADLLDKIVIDLSRDTSTAVEAITAFVEGYNAMIDALNALSGTRRPKSDDYNYYEPLTDEEKEAMSDKQVELWEEKAQTGLLYNDPILLSILSDMRTQLYQSVPMSDGTNLSLFEIGITTSSNWSDKGKLVIDEEILLAALEEKPEQVSELFTNEATDRTSKSTKMATQGIAERFTDIIYDAIGTSVSSLQKKAGIVGTYSEYDNLMYDEIKRHNEKISDMLNYLIRKENQYYLMFSKMETAMTQANAQMSYLQSMLGMNMQ